MGQHASWTGEIVFEDVHVPAENLLAREGQGFMIAMQVFDRSRPPVSAAAVGVARRAMEEATRYARERMAFGKPIIANQGVGFMLADMAIQVEAARLLVHKAAWQVDCGEPNTINAAFAKAYAADTVMKVTTDAVQVFGGYGYSREYPVEKLMRDAKIYQLYEGTSQIQRVIISRELSQRLSGESLRLDVVPGAFGLRGLDTGYLFAGQAGVEKHHGEQPGQSDGICGDHIAWEMDAQVVAAETDQDDPDCGAGKNQYPRPCG